MITIKTLSECSLEDALTAWNKGFEGYYFDSTMTVEQFTNRMVLEGLSPALSIIAYDGDKPVGLILNGIRVIDDKKVSWNGGTGVAIEYRGKGVGSQLMDASLEIYEKNNVDIATLEAIKANENAIKLYEKKGYEIVDELVHYQNTDADKLNVLKSDLVKDNLTTGLPIECVHIPFFKKFVPWQTQWNNVRDGESVIAKDEDGTTVGYAIFKRRFNEKGELAGSVLFQCEVNPELNEKEPIIKSLLNHVFQPGVENVVRSAANLSKQNEVVLDVLRKAGFELKVEQVYMEKSM